MISKQLKIKNRKIIYKYEIIYILEGAYKKLTGKEPDFIFTDATSLKNRMTTKTEKKTNPKFSRMDDSELSDIKEFFAAFFVNNFFNSKVCI